MTDDNPFKPIFDAWLTAQSEFLRSRPKDAPAFGDAWEGAARSAEAWFTEVGSNGDIARELMRKLLDPSPFLSGGGDAGQLFRDLLDSPAFSDLATLDEKILRTSGEWAKFQSACAAFQEITAKAWNRSFERFKREVGADPEVWSEGLEAVTGKWLHIVDAELVNMQKSKAFLDAQQRVIRAGAKYKTKEKVVVEAWCKAHSMPTRSEVDALHATVTQLKREIRRLKTAKG